MTKLIFEGEEIPLATGQSVLDAVHEAGRWLSYGCRSGNCQTCLVRAIEGIIPSEAQIGLDDALQASGHFLACQARPTTDLDCVRPDHEGLQWHSRVISISHANADILRLRFERPADFSYSAGQYVSIWRDNSMGRAYSLVSVPEEDDWLECYVRILSDGYMSQWFANELQRGDALSLRGPSGACYYHAPTSESPMLLIGSGVGMAPLTGVLRDAVRKGHTGPIRVYHGVRIAEDLVFDDFLRRFERDHQQVVYEPCVGAESSGETRLEARVFADHPELENWHLTLCGSPGVISRIRNRAFIYGAASRNIAVDEFVSRPGASQGTD